MNFEFNVVSLPSKILKGLFVETSMEKAAQDCPALWQNFGQTLTNSAQCNSISKTSESFGVSQMIDENRFKYWAAVEESFIPENLKNFSDLPIEGGLYVQCTVPSLEVLGEAYTAIYTKWITEQTEYELNLQGVSFELYPKDWQFALPLSIYAPIIKKA